MIADQTSAWQTILAQVDRMRAVLMDMNVAEFRASSLPEIRRGHPRVQLQWQLHPGSCPEAARLGLLAPVNVEPDLVRARHGSSREFEISSPRPTLIKREACERVISNLAEFACTSCTQETVGRVDVFGPPDSRHFPVVTLFRAAGAVHWAPPAVNGPGA